MDFTFIPDYDFHWILQIKDTFSKYIWLAPLEDKHAKTVSKALKAWISQNRRVRQL
jgi:hypothetical protein